MKYLLTLILCLNTITSLSKKFKIGTLCINSDESEEDLSLKITYTPKGEVSCKTSEVNVDQVKYNSEGLSFYAVFIQNCEDEEKRVNKLVTISFDELITKFNDGTSFKFFLNEDLDHSYLVQTDAPQYDSPNDGKDLKIDFKTFFETVKGKCSEELVDYEDVAVNVVGNIIEVDVKKIRIIL